MYSGRKNEKEILASFQRPFITALLGPRRVGKSTLVSHFREQNSAWKWCLLNMDSTGDQRVVTENGLARVIEESTRCKLGNEKIWVFIDEVQKMPRLFDAIKFLYDQYKDQDCLKFILTGSSLLDLHELSAETLAGRIELFYLREFTIKEALGLHMQVPSVSLLDAIFNQDFLTLPEIIKTLAPFRADLEAALATELIWGALPEVLKLQEPNERLRYMVNYLQTYLERDVRAIQKIDNLKLYHDLMEIIAAQTGSQRDYSKLSNALGAHRETIKKYSGYLEATLFYEEIFPFITNALKRVVKSPKAYLLNNGLLTYFYGSYDFELLSKSGQIGHRFENWFLKELKVALDTVVVKTGIYYWRSSGGQEVDFVVIKKPHTFLFEVTYGITPETKKIKNLQTLMQQEKLDYAFYIYRGEFHYDAEKRIYFLPAWAVC